MDLIEYRRKVIASSPHLKSASGAVASFSDGADLPLKSLIVDIDPVQSGTGDPSPSNVRPISGWSAVGVHDTGINLWDGEWENGDILTSNGANSDNTNKIRSKNYIPVKGGQSYYLNIPPINTSYKKRCFYDKDKVFISGANTRAGVVDVPSNACYMRFATDTNYGGTYNNDISVNYPSSDQTYHPYTGTSVTIDLGRTVYSGTLNVLTGELVIDRGYKDKDNVTKVVYTVNGNNVWLMEYDVAKFASNNVSAISSILKQGTYNGIYAGESNIVAQNSQGRLLANVDGISSVSDIDTWLAANPNFLVVYKLATPLTYHLDPQTVRSLYGQNNIFADTGNVALQYWAHP